MYAPAIVASYGITNCNEATTGDKRAGLIKVQRGTPTRLLKTGFDDCLQVLIEHSATGSANYIVASRLDRLCLLRVRNGVAIDIDDICAIGDQAAFQSVIDQYLNSLRDGTLTTGDLRYHFLDRIMTAKGLGNTIGGFPIAAVASPGRRAYLHHSGFYTYDLPEIPPSTTVEQSIEDVYTGRNHFTLAILPSSRSGLPVVGACLLQARAGWVFCFQTAC